MVCKNYLVFLAKVVVAAKTDPHRRVKQLKHRSVDDKWYFAIALISFQ